MTRHSILRITAKFMIPYILLFALYVQFHGDFGPGGGFQAGVIFASGFILYGLIFGIENARRVKSVRIGWVRYSVAHTPPMGDIQLVVTLLDPKRSKLGI